MALTIILVMLVLLLLGYPMIVPMLVATFVGFFVYFPMLKSDIIVQQMISGISPVALITVPMFILAADIVTRGHTANRLLDRAFRLALILVIVLVVGLGAVVVLSGVLRARAPRA